MSNIDQLIEKHCPNGVGYVRLGDVADTVAGLSGKSKIDFIDGNARYISYKNIFANLAVDQTAPDFVKVGLNERQHQLRRGDVLFTGSSETAEEVGMSSVVAEEPEEPLYLNSFCFGLRLRDGNLLDPEFSKYLFRSGLIRAQIQKASSGVTRINISKPRFLKVRIPVPPMVVQKEIASILNTFSKLEAELEAELEARRKQYTFYRDQLLTFTERRIRWARMTEIFSMRSGNHLSATAIADVQLEDARFPVYGGNGLRGYGKVSSHNGRYLLIGRQGALCGNIKRTSGEFYATEHAVVTEPNEEMDVDFAFYLLTAMNLNKYKSAGAQPGLAVGKLGEVLVPVPPIDEQLKIAGLLDQFDALVNDLSTGLPAELNARRKQYQHYRDRLLTFQEAK